MTIKMLTAIAGYDFSVQVGETTDRFSKAEEGRLIDAGFAERETAEETKPVAETKPARGRKKGQ